MNCSVWRKYYTIREPHYTFVNMCHVHMRDRNITLRVCIISYAVRRCLLRMCSQKMDFPPSCLQAGPSQAKQNESLRVAAEGAVVQQRKDTHLEVSLQDVGEVGSFDKPAIGDNLSLQPLDHATPQFIAVGGVAHHCRPGTIQYVNGINNHPRIKRIQSNLQAISRLTPVPVSLRQYYNCSFHQIINYSYVTHITATS